MRAQSSTFFLRRFPRGARLLGLLVVLALGASCSGSGSAQGAQATDSTAATTGTTTTDVGAGGAAAGGVQASDATVDLEGGGVTVVEMSTDDDLVATGVSVLFLHGAAYTSQTWVNNGILARVAEAGHRAIAIDLPGSGSSDGVDLDEKDFLAALFVALDLDPASTVIVSPSMSGIFSLPALREPFFADLAGYVPVAPSGAGSFADDGPAVEVPALLVWGDGDGSDPLGSADRLAEGFVDAEVLIIPDAGHAAYEQQPVVFSDALLTFVGSVTS